MGEVYAFHGSDNKSGVTMIAQSVAQLIAAENPDTDVLLVSLCGRKNDQFVREETKSIDCFKGRMESNVHISKKELINERLRKNLYHIDGLENESESRLYFPEMTRKLLGCFKEQFGLIIADTGSELDNGLSVGGLMCASKSFMVLSQNEASLKRYRRMKNLYDGLSFGFDAYIVNRYSDNDVYSLDYIKKQVLKDDKRVFAVRDVHDWRRAEFEEKTFYALRNRKFTEGISGISNYIMREAGLESGNARKGLGGLFWRTTV